MPKYTVNFTNTVEQFIEVEAGSAEEAEEAALEADEFENMVMCHHCETTVGSLGEWEVEEVKLDE